jgi:hypothetical protein
MIAFAPIASSHDPNLYRTPVWFGGRHGYSVWVGDNTARYFTSETLPEEIGVKLAMVIAGNVRSFHSWTIERVELTDDNIALNSFNFFCTHPDRDDFVDIGWRVSPSCCCLILPKKLIFEMRGAP